LKEIDRYRDAAVRKAIINAIIAMFIRKDADKMGTRPMTGAAVRRGSGTVEDNSGTERTFNLSEFTPGVYFEELQTGEVPVPYSTQGTDVNFGAFEAAVLASIAWANEIPPEILQLGFSHNYSASQAAVNEFKMYLNSERSRIGEGLLQPIWIEELTSNVLLGKVDAPGYLEARQDPRQWDVYGAWTSADWSGAIKPAVDINKMADGFRKMTNEGWTTNERASREISGTKFRKNIKRLKKENELKAEALAPLVEAQRALAGGEAPVAEALDTLESAIDALEGK
jgi:capsid protein